MDHFEYGVKPNVIMVKNLQPTLPPDGDGTGMLVITIVYQGTDKQDGNLPFNDLIRALWVLADHAEGVTIDVE